MQFNQKTICNKQNSKFANILTTLFSLAIIFKNMLAFLREYDIMSSDEPNETCFSRNKNE